MDVLLSTESSREAAVKSAIGSHDFGYHDNIESIHLLQNINHSVQMFLVPVVFTIGVIGNSISLVCLYSSELHKHAFLHYLLAIIVADSIQIVQLLIHWISTLGYDIYDSGGLCHFMSFLKRSANFLSVWFMCCLAMDMFLRATDETCCKVLSRSSKARIIILSLTAASTAVFLNTSLMEATVRLPTKSVCAPIPLFADTLRILEKLDVFINVVAPYLITIFLSLVSAYQVAKKKIYKRRHGVTGYNSETSIKHECHLLYFTLMILIALIVLPSASIRSYHTIRSFFTFDKPLNMKEYLLQELLVLLSSIKCCIHVFYLSFCSRSYRTSILMGVKKVHNVLCGWCFRQSPATTIATKLDQTEELPETFGEPTSKYKSYAHKKECEKSVVVTLQGKTSKSNLQAREASVV